MVHVRLSVLALVLVLLAACGSSASPASSGTAAANAAPAKLMVGFSQNSMPFVPVWVAVDGGITAKNKLEVDTRQATSTTGMAALLSGELNLVVTAAAELLNATAAGTDLVVLANLANVSTFRLVVHDSIKTKEDLVGKKIAITRAGSLQDTQTRIMLQRFGINPDKDVTLISIDTGPAQDAAMVNGNIQAKLTAPPSNWLLAKAGPFHDMYSLAELKVPDGILLIAQRSWYNANREVAQRYVDSVVESLSRIKTDRSLTTAAFKKWGRWDDEQILNQLYDVYVNEVLVAYPYTQPAELQDALTVVQQTDRLKGFDVNKVIDNSLVKSAEDRRVGKA